MPDEFVSAIAACLKYDGGPAQDKLEDLICRVLHRSPKEPSCEQLKDLQKQIETALPDGHDRVALVYGGATKIKGYVFEAPKLPEIRGASALLDWVNHDVLPSLWDATPCGRGGIVFGGGGHILGFARTVESEGQQLAEAIERTYARHTLTADSVAVAEEFNLLELRYGRAPMAYWVEEFLNDWTDERKRRVLETYYYLPEELRGDASEAAIRARFYNRKTFGELVGLLRIAAHRRRAERGAGASFYPLLPWSQRCDSSDVRPAVWQGQVGDEVERREMSEASARKRYAGQLAKGSDKVEWFKKNFAWRAERDEIRQGSWERQWKDYLKQSLEEHRDIPYARGYAAEQLERFEPAPDVHAIGAASDGYIGLIYADGNNVGRLMATLKTPDQYRERSKDLRHAAQDAVFHALGDHLRPHGRFHPFEIIAIGGDDLLLIVPAKYAFEVALAIGYRFESNPNLALPKPRTLNDRYRGPTSYPQYDFASYIPQIGLSAGVVIAQETAPIFFLRDLVEELLKSAKGLANKNAERGDLGGAIDFMVLKSVTMVTDKIMGFRRAALSNRADVERSLRHVTELLSPGDAARTLEALATRPEAVAVRELRQLTARPYTWHEFAGLLAAIRALQDVRMPRSQLYRLREVLDEGLQSGVLAGSLEYLHTRVRLRSPRVQEKLLTYVEHAWRPAPRHGLGAAPGAPPWLRALTEMNVTLPAPGADGLEERRKVKVGGWETIWADLVEAYEMVEEREQP